METKYFEDLAPGMVFWGDEVEVQYEAMLSFARKFDPQPMHLHEDAAKAIGLDTVIASGSFTFALFNLSMQPIVQQLAFRPGGLGIEMSFVKPVYPGDRLRLRSEILKLQPSQKPNRGFARMKHALNRQADKAVLEIENTWVIAKRPGPTESAGRT